MRLGRFSLRKDCSGLKGFTLLEVLIALAILAIGVLAAVRVFGDNGEHALAQLSGFVVQPLR